MIKLVVSDIDGTLVDQTEALREPAFEVVRLLRSQGVLFSLATGRVQGMAEAYAQALGVTVPYVTTNGAALIHQGRALKRWRVPLGPLERVIREADARGLSVIYSPDGYERVLRETPFILSQQKAFRRYFDVQPLSPADYAHGEIEKLCLMDDDRTGAIEEIERLARQLPETYGYTRYGLRAVEIVRSGRSKASGIRDLARCLHIPMSDVMVIGDDENDLEMLAAAGVGATVCNALPKVKDQADYVAEASHAAGVLEAVRRFLPPEQTKEDRDLAAFHLDLHLL